MHSPSRPGSDRTNGDTRMQSQDQDAPLLPFAADVFISDTGSEALPLVLIDMRLPSSLLL